MESHEKLTLIIAGAAFLAPIVGPIITAILTNFHDHFVYKRRFVTEHKHEAIERYLKAAGRFVFTFGSVEYYEFGESASEIFMYAPKKLWKDIQNLNDKISENYPGKHMNGGMPPEIRADLQSEYLRLCEKFSKYRRKVLFL